MLPFRGRRAMAIPPYRIAVVGDAKTGKTNLIKWFLEKDNSSMEDILVGDFIKEKDYVRVEGSFHLFKSAQSPAKPADRSRQAKPTSKYKGHQGLLLQQRKDFSKVYNPTISPAFVTTNLGEDTLQIWDISGNPSFSRLALVFEEFRNVDAFILTFSLVNRASFESLRRWRKEYVDPILQKHRAREHHNVPVIFVGTKLDHEENRKVSQSSVYEMTREPGKDNIQYFEVSARVPREGSPAKSVFEEALRLAKLARGGDTSVSMKLEEVTEVTARSTEQKRMKQLSGGGNDRKGCDPNCAIS